MRKGNSYTWRVLVVDDIHGVFFEKLDSIGVFYDYRPDINRTEALQVLANYEVLIIRSKFRIDAEVLNAAPKLKCIGRAGAGMDNIDEQLTIEKGIQLLNAPEGNRDAVAEHLIGMLLAMMNNLIRANSQIGEGKWLREANRGFELGGRTVGLIGYGNNGQAMAKKLSGFGVKVIAYDKYKTGFSDNYAEEASMEQIVKQADVLSLHIPLTAETRNLVNQEYLSHFRKPIFFLNAARGEIVDVKAVLSAIEDGSVLGAALDVLPVEKFPALAETDWYEQMKAHENVLLSPHVAGWTVESYHKIAVVLADKLLEFFRENS
ncbi:NAD(P)-dependent oxidoreductase [Olivibacter sp. XZL3]|uniref:NAD(P)-dependent oxidoreductase n=1 Tax=Olivibacter sp. XZL3 TaxID=1735116 RepID=UPI00141702D7|nr:NAD(P)-dependent oxidoreductase [Olivibacter sp. XZL3]